MTSVYPTGIDSFTNPTATDQVSVISHADQHANANDAIEALEAKVGVDGSAVTTTHDYKLSEVTGSDKAVGKTASQTLTNKTLTTPTIGSFANANHNHQDSAGGGQLNATSVFGSGTVPTARLGSGVADATTYLRGDQTWQAISNGSVAVSVIPRPENLMTSVSTVSLNTNTSMKVGAVQIANSLTVNTITLVTTDFSSSGTFKVALYTYDGATKVFEATSPTISADGVKSFALPAPVAVSTGQYYIAVLGVSGAFGVNVYVTDNTAFTALNSVASKQRFEGTVTVSAGTIPSTITPSSITSTQSHTLLCRLTQ